jgi:hypothetical protein
MSPRVAIVSAFVAAAAALAFACSEDTIVLARLGAEKGDDGGSGSSSGTATRCASSNDCGQGSYCSKTTCNDQTGTCAPLPTDCQEVYGPVCGCDGIMYYSDCSRRENGIESTWPTDGTNNCPFDVAMYCGPETPCDGGAVCSQKFRGAPAPGPLPPDCPPDIPGFCWIVPFSCSTSQQGPDRYGACGPVGKQCMDLCQAVNNRTPYHQMHSSDCPPPLP